MHQRPSVSPSLLHLVMRVDSVAIVDSQLFFRPQHQLHILYSSTSLEDQKLVMLVFHGDWNEDAKAFLNSYLGGMSSAMMKNGQDILFTICKQTVMPTSGLRSCRRKRRRVGPQLRFYFEGNG